MMLAAGALLLLEFERIDEQVLVAVDYFRKAYESDKQSIQRTETSWEQQIAGTD